MCSKNVVAHPPAERSFRGSSNSTFTRRTRIACGWKSNRSIYNRSASVRPASIGSCSSNLWAFLQHSTMIPMQVEIQSVQCIQRIIFTTIFLYGKFNFNLENFTQQTRSSTHLLSVYTSIGHEQVLKLLGKEKFLLLLPNIFNLKRSKEVMINRR